MKTGQRIKEIRISNCLTQAELSEKSGIALRTLQRIENDQVKPSIYSLKAFGDALGVPLNSELPMNNDKKFEFKIVISNFSHLVQDGGILIRRYWKAILFFTLISSLLIFYNNIKTFFFKQFDTSSISIATVNCDLENECDIELVKKDVDGNVLWKQILGGTSYDKAVQVIRTQDGSYMVLGSTSSFGKGNYDVFLVRISPLGEILWQKTYGDFLNDYGLKISELEEGLYLIEGTKQICKTVNVSNDCVNQEWLFRVDDAGYMK